MKKSIKTTNEIKEWLELSLDGFKDDPPGSVYQEGFKAALEETLKYVNL